MWSVGLLEWLGWVGLLAAQASRQAYGLAPGCGPTTAWFAARRGSLGAAHLSYHGLAYE
jgi:hypothetical protein